MFGRKKAIKGSVASPAKGDAIPLGEVEDEAFSSKMLGDGVAVNIISGDISSPCDGKIMNIAKTSHAYSILSDDGLEILVHIGIDTVELKGMGFTSAVSVGDKVKTGDSLCRADLEFIKSKGYSTVTPVVISNISDVSFLNRYSGPVSKGDVIIDYVM